MVTQSTIFSDIIFYYQVVIIKHNHKSHMNTDIALQRNDSSEQASSISEGVTEIQINSHLAREIT
jgi:hypothetical protein